MENRLERRIGKKSRHRGIRQRKRNRCWTGVRLSAPIEYTTRLYRNRETNGADGERQKRIEARVDRTIRYRPWWLSSFRVARMVSGEEGGGSPPRRRREVEIKFHVETV